MAFNTAQIADARTTEVYKGLADDNKLKISMVALLCTKVPKSAIPGHTGKMKTLDFQSMAAATGLTGFTTLDADAEELSTPMTDRDYSIGKIAKFKAYARGLDGDKLFVKIKESFVPHLDNQVKYEQDAELDTVLSGAGTAATNAQDVTVRQLSLAAGEQWSDAGSDPLGDLLSAVQDSLADTVFLGTTKANELRNHAQFQNQTGWKYATASQLASYLEDYLQVNRVVIGNKVYQDGAQAAAANLEYLGKDRCAVFNSANLLYLDWEAIEFETDDIVKSNVRELHMRVHGAIIVVNPMYFIAFQDVA
jgi:hypothetical protein